MKIISKFEQSLLCYHNEGKQGQKIRKKVMGTA